MEFLLCVIATAKLYGYVIKISELQKGSNIAEQLLIITYNLLMQMLKALNYKAVIIRSPSQRINNTMTNL